MTRRGAALAVLAAAVFFSGLDQTVVVTLLPQIAVDLHLPFTQLDEAAWIVTAYLLGYAAAMPLLGRVADVYGVRPVFLLSAVLFAAGSLWAALADGLWSLVAARAVQAAGGGGLVPVALAVAAATPALRTRLLALGLVAGAAEAGSVLGPLYGGVFLELADWRTVFWVNLPLTALLAAGAFRLLPAARRHRPRRSTGWAGCSSASRSSRSPSGSRARAWACLSRDAWPRLPPPSSSPPPSSGGASASSLPCSHPPSSGAPRSRPRTARTSSSERPSSSRSSRCRSSPRRYSTGRRRKAAFCSYA